MSSTVAKAAPRSLNQVRNVAYILAAWAGYMRGARERKDNDRLWVDHQQKLRKENAERYRAAVTAREQAHESGSGVPALVPTELQGIYQDIEKAIK